MRRVTRVVFCLMVFVSGTTAYASDSFDPPNRYSAKDSLWVGTGYFRNATKLKPVNDSFVSVSISQNQVYLQLLGAGVSLTEGGSGFLRIGAADMDDGNRFTDGFAPYGTIGIRDVWYGKSRDRFKVGTVLQASAYGSFKNSRELEVVTLKNFWEVSLGVGLQWRAANPLIFFGGPLFYYGTTKATSEGRFASISETYETKDFVGGFAGARYFMTKKLAVELDAQYKGESCLGASISYSFSD